MCEFCSTRNVIEIEMEEMPKEGEILYLQEVQRSPKDDKLVSGITKDSIVVFCIDASGSMGQTTEVCSFVQHACMYSCCVYIISMYIYRFRDI